MDLRGGWDQAGRRRRSLSVNSAGRVDDQQSKWASQDKKGTQACFSEFSLIGPGLPQNTVATRIVIFKDFRMRSSDEHPFQGWSWHVQADISRVSSAMQGGDNGKLAEQEFTRSVEVLGGK